MAHDRNGKVVKKFVSYLASLSRFLEPLSAAGAFGRVTGRELLVFLSLLISAMADVETFNRNAGLFPFGAIIVGWFFRRRSRFQPSR